MFDPRTLTHGRRDGGTSLYSIPGEMPEAVLPEQLDRKAFSAEQRLMLAVLEDAINVIQKPSASRTKGKVNASYRDDALRWVRSTDASWQFSFERVCEAVGLDPGFLRPRLLAMAEQTTAERDAVKAKFHVVRSEPVRTKVSGKPQEQLGRPAVSLMSTLSRGR